MREKDVLNDIRNARKARSIEDFLCKQIGGLLFRGESQPGFAQKMSDPRGYCGSYRDGQQKTSASYFLFDALHYAGLRSTQNMDRFYKRDEKGNVVYNGRWAPDSDICPVIIALDDRLPLTEGEEHPEVVANGYIPKSKMVVLFDEKRDLLGEFLKGQASYENLVNVRDLAKDCEAQAREKLLYTT